MQIAVTLQSQAFSTSEVRDVVGLALASEMEHARVRRDYFAQSCHQFEQRYALSSAEFVIKFDAGELGDDVDLFDWFAAKRGFDLWDRRFNILSELTL